MSSRPQTRCATPAHPHSHPRTKCAMRERLVDVETSDRPDQTKNLNIGLLFYPNCLLNFTGDALPPRFHMSLPLNRNSSFPPMSELHQLLSRSRALPQTLFEINFLRRFASQSIPTYQQTSARNLYETRAAIADQIAQVWDKLLERGVGALFIMMRPLCLGPERHRCIRFGLLYLC